MREIDNICTHENLAPITYLVLDSVGEFRLMFVSKASGGYRLCHVCRLYVVVILGRTLDRPVVDDGQQLIVVPKQLF